MSSAQGTDVAIEDAMTFQVPGDEEEKEHGSGCPVKNAEGKGAGKAEVAAKSLRFGFIKERSAYECNGSGESQPFERVRDSLLQLARWNEKGSMEDGVKREDA